jgi:hypothetical protein
MTYNKTTADDFTRRGNTLTHKVRKATFAKSYEGSTDMITSEGMGEGNWDFQDMQRVAIAILFPELRPAKQVP